MLWSDVREWKCIDPVTRCRWVVTFPPLLIYFWRSVRRSLLAACIVPSSSIFVTLMKEAPGSSETSVFTRATQRNNPEDTILQATICLSCLMGKMKWIEVKLGRVVACVVICRFPTEATRVMFQFNSGGICDGNSGTGAEFLRVNRFTLSLISSKNCSKFNATYHPGLVQ
jgi:hypothetical protein